VSKEKGQKRGTRSTRNVSLFPPIDSMAHDKNFIFTSLLFILGRRRKEKAEIFVVTYSAPFKASETNRLIFLLGQSVVLAVARLSSLFAEPWAEMSQRTFLVSVSPWLWFRVKCRSMLVPIGTHHCREEMSHQRLTFWEKL
jgi:hypothetical protein